MSAQPTQAKASAAVEPMTLAFDVTVTAVQELSPNFRRITFGGYSLRDFGVAGGDTLDLRVKLMIPSFDAAGQQIPLPPFKMEEAGWYQEWLAMDPSVRGDMRTYTVRSERLDAVYPEIDIDFVMHFDDAGHGGPAANWHLRRNQGGTPSPSSAPTTAQPSAPRPAPTAASNGVRAWPSACSWPATKPLSLPSAPSWKACPPI